MPALAGTACRWEPKRLRFRLFAVGRLASSGRRRLCLAAHWPWAGEITAATARLQAIPLG